MALHYIIIMRIEHASIEQLNIFFVQQCKTEAGVV